VSAPETLAKEVIWPIAPPPSARQLPSVSGQKKLTFRRLTARSGPPSILCLENKVVQQPVATVLEAIYEEDLLGRPTGSGRDAPSTMRRTLRNFTAGSRFVSIVGLAYFAPARTIGGNIDSLSPW
jgi:hypothetical protein